MSNAAQEYPIDIEHSEYATSGPVSSYYLGALRAIALNPGLTNKGVAEAVGGPLGSMGPPCRAARDTLGISDTRGANTAYIEDYDRYTRGCAALGVTPQKAKAFAKVHEPADISAREDAVSSVAALATTPAALTRPPATVRQAPVPAGDAMQEVRRLVRSLRERMVALDLERIEITATDTNVTRTVRTTSSFKL